MKKLFLPIRNLSSSLLWRFPAWPLFVLPLIVYLPCFATFYAWANDYYLIPPADVGRAVYHEAPELFYYGRAFQAYLLTWSDKIVSSVGQLGFLRFGAFLFLLGFAFFFDRFLRRRFGLERFWSQAVTLSLIFLPSIQVFIAWAIFWAGGTLPLFLSMLSYAFLDESGVGIGQDAAVPTGQGRQSFGVLLARKSFFLMTAMVLFWAALFLYQSNAVFVFVCTCCYLFLSLDVPLRRILWPISRDVIFYGLGLGIYFMIHKNLLLPHPPAWASQYVLTNTPLNQYAVQLGFDLQWKVPLFIESLAVGLSGSWQLLIGNAGALITGGIILTTLAVDAFVLSRPRKQGFARLIFRGLFCTGVFFVLFFLANSPLFLAKNGLYVSGYRVIFPATAIFSVMCLAGLWRIEKRRQAHVNWTRGAALILVLMLGLIAFWQIFDFTHGMKIDRDDFMRQLRAKDLSDVRQIVVVPREEKIPWHEFRGSLDDPVWTDLFVRSCLRVLVSPEREKEFMIALNQDENIYYDDHTLLLYGPERRTKEELLSSQKTYVHLRTSDDAERRIEILRITPDSFVFYEKNGDRDIPFWRIEGGTLPPKWIYFESQGAPLKLAQFQLAALEFGSSHLLPVLCFLQGSQDGQSWQDLPADFQHSIADHRQRYQVLEPKSFLFYRLGIAPQEPRAVNLFAILFSPVFGDMSKANVYKFHRKESWEAP